MRVAGLLSMFVCVPWAMAQDGTSRTRDLLPTPTAVLGEDGVLKPVSPRQVKAMLHRVGRPAEARAEIAGLRHTADLEGRFGHLRGRATVMQLVYTQIGRVAGSAVTVFVVGESGAGKELVAQTVHDLSRRRKAPFLAVNIGAI